MPSDPPTAQTDERSPPHKVTHLLGSRPPKGAVISDVALDKFAYETNGAPFPSESKAELKQFLECDDQGRLTVRASCDGRQRIWTDSSPTHAEQYQGFLGLYHLQSDNDPDETWK